LMDKLRRADVGFQPQRILRAIGETMLFYINENFRRRGQLFGMWPKMADNTPVNRRQGKGGGSAQLLRDNGMLQQSFTIGEPGNVWEVGQNSVTVGTRVEYAKYHHFGTKGPYRIPKYHLRYKTDKLGRRYVVPLAFNTLKDGLIFRRYVMHPGLPVRRLIPDQILAEKYAKQAAAAAVNKIIQEANLNAGN